MTWADILVAALKKAGISLIAYVPDLSIYQATRLMEDDPYFQVISSTREEEAIGVAVGAYAVGRRSAVFMQSSGLGNCVNAIASLCLPCRTPIPSSSTFAASWANSTSPRLRWAALPSPSSTSSASPTTPPHHHR